MKCSTSNADVVADWSFSSLDTKPRQKSDESTSNGAKCFRANVDFPHPEGPTSTTSASSGIVRARPARCGVSAAVCSVIVRRSA
jgi:hypothetical protein